MEQAMGADCPARRDSI